MVNSFGGADDFTSSNQSSNPYWLICLTLFFGLVLSVVQLPPMLMWARPAWLVLLTIYWVVVVPHRFGVTAAWCLGILFDVLQANVLGQHALALSLVAFLSFILHLRLRVLPVWQQLITVFVLTGIYQLALRVIQGLTGDVTDKLLYWLPSISSALCWPLVLWALNFLSKKTGAD